MYLKSDIIFHVLLKLSFLSFPGALRVNQRIDYEQVRNVTLIAQAFDTGSPQLQNTAVVYIKIININDNTPVFSPVCVSLKD